MRRGEADWAIVLAAGDGTRLRPLTTRSGVTVPKQFCSLGGGRSLFADAVARARNVVAEDHVLAVVAEKHRPFFERELRDPGAPHAIVQPANRGTAVGVLLPLLAIAKVARGACVVLLPSDHYVADEQVLSHAVVDARIQARHSGSIVLLGVTPDAAVPDYGWILPFVGDGPVRNVAEFVEKPDPERALQIRTLGGLWNSFVIVTPVPVLLELYEQRHPELVRRLSAALDAPVADRRAAIARVYEDLPVTDFSRDLLQGAEDRLRVLRVPACGWTDLGTPARVAACLRDEAVSSFDVPMAQRGIA